MSEPEIYILGTKVLAEEFFALATDAGVPVEAFVENEDPAKEGTSLCGRPVIWVDRFPAGGRCVCAYSTAKRRRFIEQVADRAVFTRLIHPSAIVLPGATVGEGCILSAGVIVATNAVLGKYVFLNRGVRIGHHTRLADYVVAQPGANIAGLIEIGEATCVGMGAIVIERLKIGRGVTVAAGAVVIRDVADHTMVAGNPAVTKKVGIDVR